MVPPSLVIRIVHTSVSVTLSESASSQISFDPVVCICRSADGVVEMRFEPRIIESALLEVVVSDVVLRTSMFESLIVREFPTGTF